ncbi:MAG TPA: lyase family protein [Patescibacteria group bacterium]|nr:lyase family protein [Patescibacteria group bacterium]
MATKKETNEKKKGTTIDTRHVPFHRRVGMRLMELPDQSQLRIKPGPEESQIPVLPIHHMFDKAHLVMLAEQGIIPKNDSAAMLRAFRQLEKEGVVEGRLRVGAGMFSGEKYLIEVLGEEVGGLIHIGRSTGDMVGVSIRVKLREELLDLIDKVIQYNETLLKLAEKHALTIIPTYTNMMEAETTSFAHYLLAFVYKADRAIDRLEDIYGSVNRSPAGAAIGTGSPIPLSRERQAELLGFDEVIVNTYEAISTENKSYIIDAFGGLALLMCSVEKLLSDMYIWITDEFDMIDIADRFCGTSSIMPQKKNTHASMVVGDFAHKVYGLMTKVLFDETAIIAWPRGADILACTNDCAIGLEIASSVMASVKIKENHAKRNLNQHWAAAVDLADAMVKELGLSFRTAHQIVAILVRHAVEKDIGQADLSNDMIKQASMEYFGKPLELKKETIRKVLDPVERIKARTLTGGPAPENTTKQIKQCYESLKLHKKFVSERRGALDAAARKLEQSIDKLLGSK